MHGLVEQQGQEEAFLLMCYYKASHRSWERDENHKHLYYEDIGAPDTFSDDLGGGQINREERGSSRSGATWGYPPEPRARFAQAVA
jgi:hypothetical protein